jgi:choice-of-anchor B domain-containing protein
MTELGYFDVVSLHSSQANDIWGYVDGAGNEYAIVGLNDGTSIINVTDPANPFEVFYAPGMNSIWRDIKTWNHHAYVTTEAQNGLLIIDLSTLPGNTNLTTTLYTGPVGDEWQSAHNLYIDSVGFCYIFGANRGEGGTIILDLNPDPMNPVEVGVQDSYYTHDGVVLGNILYQGHINDGFFTLHDISDKQNPIYLGQRASPGNFTHNLWFSDDGKYLYTTDEISNGYLGEYNIEDPLNIEFSDKIQSSPGMNVIPHNVHFINDYIVTSYYRDGVTVHDVSNKGNMIEVGNFDTSPAFSGDGFNGCWGVYPWLPSGNIISADIENGLHILGANYIRGAYLEGVITDAVSSLPIALANVTILASTVADASILDGSYKTGIALAGTYDVVYSHPNYYSDTIFGLALTNGVVTIQNVALNPIQTFTVLVSGETVGQLNISNAEVIMQNEDFTFTGNSGVTGVITFTNVIPGDYELTIGKWGFVTQCSTVTVTGDQAFEVTLNEGYYDDFTFDFNWQVSGAAPSGIWERGVPIGTTSNGNLINPDADHTTDCSDKAYITGNAGGQAGADDVDIAETILTSPIMDLTTYDFPQLNCMIWWNNSGGTGIPNDSLKIILTNGTQTVTARIFRNIHSGSTWQPVSLNVYDFITPNATVKAIFYTADWQAQGGHLVEAGVDYFRIEENLSASVNEFTANQINVFPNPSNEAFQVAGIQYTEYFIYSNLGVLIEHKSVDTANFTFGQDLPKGIYMVQLMDKNKQVYTKKIVKL